MICRTCNLDKPASAYYLDANGYRTSPDCKLCVAALKRGARQSNAKGRSIPERGREWFRVEIQE